MKTGAGAIILPMLGLFGGCADSAQGDSNVYTLYRTTSVEKPTPELMRIHVATFDADAEEDYNRENCETARLLFQSQHGVIVKYFCEKGRFRQ